MPARSSVSATTRTSGLRRASLPRRPSGPFTGGLGRILPAEQTGVSEAALDRYYGLRRRMYEGLGSKLGVQTVYIEITPVARTTEGRAG